MEKKYLKNIVMMLCIFVFGITFAFGLKNAKIAYATPATAMGTYTATFYANGGTWTNHSGSSWTMNNLSGNSYFSELGVNNITKKCATLDGWKTKNGTTVLHSYINTGGSFYAVWNETKYTVTFALSGGIYNGSSEEFTKTVCAGEAVAKPSNPTYSTGAYRFVHWSTTLDGPAYNFSAPVTKDLTLAAVWEKIRYTVSFNLNGGSGNISSQTVDYGSNVKKPTNPTRSGYTFQYWSTSKSGGEYNFNNAVTSSFTLYAVWEKNSTSTPTPTQYTVKFDLQGGSGSANTQTITSGNKVSKPTNPTRSGYTFQYWSTSKSGGEYNFNNAVTSSFTLYAIWKQNSSSNPTPTTPSNPSKPPTPSTPSKTYYTVTFDLNGGEGNIESQSVEKNGNVTKPSTNPTKSNATFVNWSTSSSCGSEYDFSKKVTSNMTLYACYKNNYKIAINMLGLPYSKSNTLYKQEGSNLNDYSQSYSLTIVDATTYSIGDMNKCKEVMLKFNSGLSDREQEERCSSIANTFDCSKNSDCIDNKYLVLNDIQSNKDVIVYLRNNNFIELNYEIYEYKGLYSDNKCQNEYKYTSKITKDLSLYQCFDLIENNEPIVIEDPKAKSSFGEILTKIVIGILIVALIASPIVYFVLKSKRSNSVD